MTRGSMRDRSVAPRSGSGLRFSWFDALFVAIAGGATLATWDLPGGWGAWIATVAGHFLLFCNVVRLRPAYELIWAAFFVTIAVGSAMATGLHSWTLVVALTAPITLGLVLAEMCSGRYRGLGSSTLNTRPRSASHRNK